MAFEQNSLPKDSRPLNIARTVSDETRIAPLTTTSGRNIEGYYVNPPTDTGNPVAIPVFYPPAMPDSGFVGVGYSNVAAPRGVAWVSRVPTAVVAPPPSANLATGYWHNPAFGTRASPTASDQASEESGEDSVSGKKVKFLCSFGGKILPRPSDGMLRYVGGQTRIISVRKDISYNELVQKMVEINGQNVIIKYQLPDEDLDALVLVSCPDDLENMMEEYEKLVQMSSDGMGKLRVFLFSSSEFESTGLMQLGETQSNRRYFEAVNGIGDGVGSGITRKDSMTSGASTHNSDLSGTEATDNLGQGLGDITGPPSTGILSPRTDSATSQELPPKVVHLDPSHGIYVHASNVPSGTSAAMTGLPQPLSFLPQHGFDRSVPATVQKQQIGVELLHPGVNFLSSQSYLPPNMGVGPHQVANAEPQQVTNVGPQQVTLSGTDYVQVPAPMGFPSQLLGTVGPVFARPQFHDTASNVSSHQFITAGHVTMAPPHVSVTPNVIRPILQPHQMRLEQNTDEMGIRFIQIPADQAYTPYQGQVQPAVVGGGYGWNQVSQPEQVVISEGWVPHQQTSFPERIPRFQDCFMCDKALPHAHSDTIVQDQSKSPASAQPDLNQVYHSLHLDDKMRALPINRVAAPGAAGECLVDQSRQNILSHMDYEGKSPLERVEAPQNVLKQYGNDRVILQKPGNRNQFEVSVSQSVVGLGISSPSPYGVVAPPPPQLFHESATQQQAMPLQYQVRQEISKPVNSDVHTGRGTPIEPSDNLIHESPREYSGNLPTAAPKEDSAELYDHVKQTDGRMENLHISPPDAFVNREQSKEELLAVRPQQITGKEPYTENSFNQPMVFPDTNQLKPDEISPSSDELSYLHNIRALESFDVTQPPPPLATTISHQQPKFGNNCLASDVGPHGNIASSGVDSMGPQEKVPPVGEWKDNPSVFPPKAILGDVEMSAFDGNTRSSSPPHKPGNEEDTSNSLFSNQDPWSLQHDSHFLPPRPNKIAIRKEGLSPKDRFGENHLMNGGELPISGGGGLAAELQWDDHRASDMNFGSDQTRAAQGSAEDLIKQDLQAVAEGVAASVLLSAPVSPDSDVQSIDGEVRKPKLEGNKSKVMERTNLGFPVSDGIGRLQIIKNSDLEELRELGSGTFGTVYHGKWRGTDVAIKRINDRCFAGKASEQERMRDDFWNEAIKLADLHHPNVVAFYGVVLDGPGGSVATVTEYMVNGSLRTALQKNERNLDKRKRLLIAMDVAFGMEYLHGKNIVHFDLKSDNLLVNLRDPHRPICKVGDLGLSKVKCQTLISGGVRGTLPWMAPELLNGSSSLVSEKVDVFSFGIVMWELLTGEEPYADLHYGAIIGGIVSNTLRPPVPETCDSEWRSLMERCWSAEPSERPNFTEIANELRSTATKATSKTNSPTAQPVVKS